MSTGMTLVLYYALCGAWLSLHPDFGVFTCPRLTTTSIPLTSVSYWHYPYVLAGPSYCDSSRDKQGSVHALLDSVFYFISTVRNMDFRMRIFSHWVSKSCARNVLFTCTVWWKYKAFCMYGERWRVFCPGLTRKITKHVRLWFARIMVGPRHLSVFYRRSLSSLSSQTNFTPWQGFTIFSHSQFCHICADMSK